MQCVAPQRLLLFVPLVVASQEHVWGPWLRAPCQRKPAAGASADVHAPNE